METFSLQLTEEQMEEVTLNKLKSDLSLQRKMLEYTEHPEAVDLVTKVISVLEAAVNHYERYR